MTLHRLKLARWLFLVLGTLILFRLFYWQVLASESLSQLAQSQHLTRESVPGQRGEIYTSDNFPLVQNQTAYLAYAYAPDLNRFPDELVKLLAPLLEPPTATTPADKVSWQQELHQKFTSPPAPWFPLAKKVTDTVKTRIESLNLSGIGFEPQPTRFYPEASTAAHLVGFLGQNSQGVPQGYFGLEGFYDLELRGRPGELRQEKDATGKPIPVGIFAGFSPQDGRDLKLHLNRALQLLVEDKLASGLQKYSAAAGEVIVMDPHTGAILALAALPRYHPAEFPLYQERLYKNPSIADSYEPGSTFKILVLAAALDVHAVTPDTRCDICTGPFTIGKYTLRTWNNEYHPDITTTEIIQKSDNIGMVFVGQKLGLDRLLDYLDKFGIGQPTNIDLEEETSPKLRPRQKWGEIGLATASFGQGVAVTGIQMVTAVAAIANGGKLLQPQVVSRVLGETEVTIKPKVIRQVISPQTAQIMKDLMVNAIENGEAQWTKLKGYKIAGKTGTAQIPVSGHYDEEKTIASFIGFAPADDPKFVMLVKLREPQSSPWAAETAAPLWFSLAKDILLYYNIPPTEP